MEQEGVFSHQHEHQEVLTGGHVLRVNDSRNKVNKAA